MHTLLTYHLVVAANGYIVSIENENPWIDLEVQTAMTDEMLVKLSSGRDPLLESLQSQGEEEQFENPRPPRFERPTNTWVFTDALEALAFIQQRLEK